MFHRPPRPVLPAAVLMCLLSAMLFLSSDASPPFVAVSELSGIEEGTVVCVVGLAVELWTYDSGTDAILLADIADGATAKALCTPGLKPQPSTYTHLGDELMVTGEIASSATGIALYTMSDGVELVRKAEVALTMGLLCEHWQLFEGDQVTVAGRLVAYGQTGDYRLADEAGEHSVMLDGSPGPFEGLLGSDVFVEGRIKFDESIMAVVISATSLRPAQ